MKLDICAEKVLELQSYVGKVTSKGLTVLEVIIGPRDEKKIAGFVNVHFHPKDLQILKITAAEERFEPWVLCGTEPDGLPQKFKDAFPE